VPQGVAGTVKARPPVTPSAPRAVAAIMKCRACHAKRPPMRLPAMAPRQTRAKGMTVSRAVSP
jgi:hypothetical protein